MSDMNRERLLYSGTRRIIQANWAVAVKSWYTNPAKNDQNTPGNAMLNTCKSMAVTPNAPNRSNMNRVTRSRCRFWRSKRRKIFVVALTNNKVAINAIPLQHLQIPGGIGLMLSSSNPSIDRPNGRMELASKSRNRSLSTPDHSCTDSWRKTTTTPASPANATRSYSSTR
jgi:hypothetical protein